MIILIQSSDITLQSYWNATGEKGDQGNIGVTGPPGNQGKAGMKGEHNYPW